MLCAVQKKDRLGRPTRDSLESEIAVQWVGEEEAEVRSFSTQSVMFIRSSSDRAKALPFLRASPKEGFTVSVGARHWSLDTTVLTSPTQDIA